MEDFIAGSMVFFSLIMTILGLSYVANCHDNNEDRKINQCRVTADREPAYNCQEYSIYYEWGTCSCVLVGTNDRVKFQNTWEEE